MHGDHVTSPWEPSPGFWKGRRVLVTGHTGFKGGWLSCVLSMLDAKVFGYSLDEKPSPNAYDIWKRHYKTETDQTSADIVDQTRFLDYLKFADPEIVIHLAAQPLVIDSYNDPLGTVRTNVLGTASLLDACRRRPGLAAIVVVTSDKVYREAGTTAYTEADRLGGADIYSASKACCEFLTDSFREAFFSSSRGGDATRLATARAGNVVGGGDWSANRLIPDLVRAYQSNQSCLIRNPLATRPWQHVLEPLIGYLCLVENLVTGKVRGEAWNFGPSSDQIHPVKDVAETVANTLNGLRVSYEGSSDEGAREMEHLRIDSSKSRQHLGWAPKLTFEQAIDMTCLWYRADSDLARREVTESQITEYLNM